MGRRISEVDQANITNWFCHDGLGRLIYVTNALNQVTGYGHDEVGNQITQTDARTNTTWFFFDKLGRRTKRQLPGGQSETFGFDLLGNMLAHTNFNGLVITNLFDSRNRLLSKWHGSTNLESHGYDAAGQRTGRHDGSGDYAWVYDNRGRVRTNSTPAGAFFRDFDANGNPTGLSSSSPGGTWVTFQYDALNRMTNVIDNRLTGNKNTGYLVDAAGNLTGLKYPNGVTNLWQFNSLNRLTFEVWKSNSAALATFTYQLGLAGNRTNLNETVNGTNRNFGWSYDQLYRLTNEYMGSLGNLGYNYDQVGNRTNRASSVTGITNQTFGFGSNDWLNIDIYDSEGNTRTNGGNVFLYDYADRLTNANNGGVVIVYDADGNRIKKTVGTNVTLFLVDTHNPSGYAQVLEELTVIGGTTNLARAYTYGLALISQRVPNSSTNFFGHDGLGSTRFLVDAGGTVVNSFAYDAYGTLIASNGPPQTAYLFTGQQFDSDLGFYSNRARFLNSNTGRFWTMDTFEGNPFDPLSLLKYLYASANPANRIDPSGHDDNLATQLGGTVPVGGAIAGTTLPAISGAKVAALLRLATVAVAVAATITGDEATNSANLMRLQLQESDTKHYWSAAFRGPSSGVTRNQVQLNLNAMWSALQLLSALDWKNDEEWDRFRRFGSWETRLYSAVIRMSLWVGSHGPTEPRYYTVHQEYGDPTDETSPRIDLENIRGINLRQ